MVSQIPARLIICSLFVAALAVLSVPVVGAEEEAAVRQALARQQTAARAATEIVDLVSRGRYAAAEDRLSRILADRAMTTAGYRLLESVYHQLAATELPAVWDRWCEHSPGSHFPFAVRGMFRFEKARAIDGANRTRLLSTAQRQAFERNLRLAYGDLVRAAELNRDDPGPPATLAALAAHLELPRTDMEEWYDRSTAADPRWLAAYHAKLSYLAPWRQGSNELMRQFARECFADPAPDSTRYIVTLDYLRLMVNRIGDSIRTDRFLLAPGTYAMVSIGVDRYQREFPHSPRLPIYRELLERTVKNPYVAIAAFSDLLARDSSDRTARRGRISAYLAGRQYDKAEADLKQLEGMTGPTPFTLASRGLIAFVAGSEPDVGSVLFDRAIAGETSSYHRKIYFFQRAEALQRIGRHREAIADFSAALGEDILFEDAYFGRAKSRYAVNDRQGALADLMMIKSTIQGRLTVKARSLLNTYLRPQPIPSGEVDSPSYLRQIPSDEPALERTAGLDAAREGQPPALAREYLLNGLQRHYQGETAEARRLFFRVLALDPENAKAFFMLGQISEAADVDKALIFYSQAHRLAPGVADYAVAVARCLYRQQRFAEAVSLLTTVLETDAAANLPARWYFLRGLCLEEMGLIPEATEDMRRAARLDPGLKAARIFLRDHDRDTASGRPVSAGAEQPAAGGGTAPLTAAELTDLGRTHLANGDAGAARLTLVKAIRADPGLDEAHHLLGRLFFEHERDYAKSLLYYDQAIALDDRVAAYYFDRGASHFFFRRYESARADFTAVLERDPDSLDSLYYRAVCNLVLGDTAAARRDFTALRSATDAWNIEIERFLNAWNAEVDRFLTSDS